MIVDVHTHFYDPSRPEGVHWPDPGDKVLYRTVLPEHFLEVGGPSNAGSTVVVEASKWVEDNQWILGLARDNPCIVGFVGFLDPRSDDFERDLDRFSANPLYRGIRLMLRSGPEEHEKLIPQLRKLAEHDLELDLMTDGPHLETNALLAREIPELRIVINHVAHVPVTGNAPDPVWVKGIEAIARHPNVYCKVSGMVERAEIQPAPEDPSYYVPTLDALWNAFGENRLVFGSNWPVCERNARYETVFNIVRDYFGKKGKEAEEKFFQKNSKAAYKWVAR